jgi:hypothetical protein
MHKVWFGVALCIAVAAIGVGCECEKETPPPPLLPPPLDQSAKVPPPPSPLKFPGPAIPPSPAPPLGGAKTAFAGVKPMLTAPAGTAKSGRGDFTAFYAKLQEKVLWVWIEFKGPVDKDLNYRFWISNERKDPPTLAMVDKGASGIQVHDGGKIFGNIKLPIDTADGLLLRLPLKDLPPNLRDAKRLWVGNFGSIEVKDLGGDKFEVVTYKAIDQTIEAMPIPDR